MTRKTAARVVVYLVIGLAVLLVPYGTFRTKQASRAAYPKVVSFSVCEDYDKNQDLSGIEKDFQLLKELEVDTMRVSFGWDDYEPQRGKYDFEWLHKFADLAAKHGIKLRPYLCYAPRWASGGEWNSPPRNYKDWYDFCYNLAREMKRHRNIVSYEIWNEEDGEDWWSGSAEQYREVLKQGALAIRAADSGKEILLGGLVWPDDDWLRGIADVGYDRYYEVTPLHCYTETWTEGAVENYLEGEDYGWFVRENRRAGKAKPIWVNEIGYSTLYRTEAQQANYMCRAVSYFFSVPEIRMIGWYEITDMNPGKSAIGDVHNYHFGITARPDRKPRLAFHTLDMLTDLLDKKQVLPADEEVSVKVISGIPVPIYKHLFKLADRSQVLFIYTKDGECTVNVTLKTPGKSADKYELNNTRAAYPDFANNTLSNIALKPREVQVFKIVP